MFATRKLFVSFCSEISYAIIISTFSAVKFFLKVKTAAVCEFRTSVVLHWGMHCLRFCFLRNIESSCFVLDQTAQADRAADVMSRSRNSFPALDFSNAFGGRAGGCVVESASFPTVRKIPTCCSADVSVFYSSLHQTLTLWLSTCRRESVWSCRI